MVGVIIYFSLPSSPPVPGFRFSDKVFHVAGYAGVMSWFAQLYVTQRNRLLCAIGFILMGIGLEFAQDMGGIRNFEFADMVANTAGVILAWVLWRYWRVNLLQWFEGVLHGKT